MPADMPSRREVAEEWLRMATRCTNGHARPVGICWRCSMPATWHADKCHDCPPKPKPGDLVRLRGTSDSQSFAKVEGMLPGDGASIRWTFDGGKTWLEPATSSLLHLVPVEVPS